jgi:hypothetical protein
MKQATPECFGTQAGALLEGRTPVECVECEWFEKCHKITVAAALLSISDSLDLIVQNGIAEGRLKGLTELEKAAGAASGKA